MPLSKRVVAEFIGTFWLVFGGCGAAVLACNSRRASRIGLLGVSFAFGLHRAADDGVRDRAHLRVSPEPGRHDRPRRRRALPGEGDPALRRRAGRRRHPRGARVLYLIASGAPGFELGGFASNGFDAHSPGQYSMVAALVAELVLTFMFLIIILGATDARAPKGFAPIPIGLGLTLIHLIGIPVTNLSVNPTARSTGPALVVGVGLGDLCSSGSSGSRPSSAPRSPASPTRPCSRRRPTKRPRRPPRDLDGPRAAPNPDSSLRSASIDGLKRSSALGRLRPDR